MFQAVHSVTCVSKLTNHITMESWSAPFYWVGLCFSTLWKQRPWLRYQLCLDQKIDYPIGDIMDMRRDNRLFIIFQDIRHKLKLSTLRYTGWSKSSFTVTRTQNKVYSGITIETLINMPKTEHYLPLWKAWAVFSTIHLIDSLINILLLKGSKYVFLKV